MPNVTYLIWLSAIAASWLVVLRVVDWGAFGLFLVWAAISEVVSLSWREFTLKKLRER